MAEPDLFQPSVRHANIALPPPGQRPWRPSSGRIVGFFGGPLAATMHALVNLERLGASDTDEARRVRRLGYGVTAAVIVAQIVVVFLLVEDVESMREHRRNIRLVAQIGGLGVGHFLAVLLAGPERRWLHRVGGSEESYDGAFWPGLRRVMGWGLVSAIPVVAAVVLRIFL